MQLYCHLMHDLDEGRRFRDAVTTREGVEKLGGMSETSAEGTTHSVLMEEQVAFANWINMSVQCTTYKFSYLLTGSNQQLLRGVLFPLTFILFPSLPFLPLLVAASAQTVYALRVLRSRGPCDTALQHVYRSTVIARLMYAVSAWRRLTSTSHRQRIDSVIDRARRYGYCASDLYHHLMNCVTRPTTSCSTRLFACLISSSAAI